MICDHRLRTILAITSFLTVFLGVNTIIWIIAGEPAGLIAIGLAGYIVVSSFTGVYTAVSMGETRTGRLFLVAAESLLTLGVLPMRRYLSSGRATIAVMAVTILLTMGFLSSYWYYRLYGEACFEQINTQAKEDGEK